MTELICNFCSKNLSDHTYAESLDCAMKLIKDGRKNKVLSKRIYNDLKVTMVHGDKDKSVPVNYSRKVLKIFKNAKKKLIIVKNGDHSLSSPKWLILLKKELESIIN